MSPRTLEDYDPVLRRQKTFNLIGQSIIVEYEKSLDHSKHLIDERDFPRDLDTSKFEMEIANADLGKMQKRRLISILRTADKDLKKANNFANYIRYQWQCHSWNWQAEKAKEDLQGHSSITDELKERLCARL